MTDAPQNEREPYVPDSAKAKTAAHDRSVAPYWWPDTRTFIVIWMCISSFFIVVLFWWKPPANDNTLLNTIIGVYIGTGLVTALGWWMGSSKGSDDKSKALAQSVDNTAAANAGRAVLSILIALVLGLLLFGSDIAYAQQAALPRGPIGQRIHEDLAAKGLPTLPSPGGGNGAADTLFKDLQKVTKDDVTYAKALADGVGSPGAKLRANCYAAIITSIDQSQGANVTGTDGKPLTEPDPHLFTALERVAQAADNLAPNGPLMSACAAAAAAAKLTVTQFITMGVTGAASLGALGLP